jgi:hypothetical protein
MMASAMQRDGRRDLVADLPSLDEKGEGDDDGARSGEGGRDQDLEARRGLSNGLLGVARRKAATGD